MTNFKRFLTLTLIATLSALCMQVWGTAATLPFEYDGNGTGTLPNGLSVSGTGTYSSSPKIKFDGTGDYIVIQFSDTPDKLGYTIKGNPGSGTSTSGTFDVMQSSDGSTYTSVRSYTNKDNSTTTESDIALSSSTRYIKFIYTNKNSNGGNIAIGAISISKASIACDKKVNITKSSDPLPSGCSFALDKTGDVASCSAVTLTITPTCATHYSVTSVTESNSRTVTNNGDGTWSVTYAANSTGSSVISVTFTENTHHTVTFQNNGETLASDGTREVYDGEAVGTLPVLTSGDACDLTSTTFKGWTEEVISTAQSDAPSYITAETIINGAKTYNAVWAKEVTGTKTAGTPVSYTGGGKNTLTAITGVSASGLGSDYTSHSPYQVRFDDTGDYIQFDLAYAPTQISFGYKMIGGNSTSSVTIKECSTANGSYSNVQSFSISGAQNSTGTHTTSATFSQRFIRMVFTKGSNIGIGPITVTGYVNDGTSYTDFITDCGVGCSTPTLVFDNATVNKFDGDAPFTNPLTVTGNDLDAEVTYSISCSSSIAEVNATTGEVTIHNAMNTTPVTVTATLAKKTVGTECQKAVKATYTLNIYNKVTWLVGGDEYTTGGPTTQTTEGGEIETFPTDPNGACDGKTFMGWTTGEYEGATAPATLYTNSSTVHITSNTTFHAVFAEPGGESETVFRKITSLSELTGGKRVLIVNGNYALDSVANDYGNVAYPIIIYGGKITVNRASLIWTVGTGSNGGYYFSQGENYLNSWPSSGGVYHYIWVDEYTDEWTIVSGTGSGPFSLKSTEDDPYKLCKGYDSGDGVHYFNVSTGSGTTKYEMDFYVPDIGYTNYATSCCDEVESPTATVLARSTTATISWTNQVEATNGYSLVVKEGETTVFEQTSIAAGTTSIEATGLHESTAHTFVLTAKGATCNRSYYGDFTTTDCDDVPYDIIITPALKSATFKWTAVAATATIKLYSDEECNTEVKSQSGAISPATISGLNENTTYYVKIGAGTSGNCYGEPKSFTTNSTSIELAEWFPDSIRINLEADAHASVVIEDKQEKQSGGTAKVADKLFFAKYFEGEGSMKLISIYNGTDADEDLSSYKIIVITRSKGEVSTKEYDLSSVNTIYKGQEIIFFTRPLDSEAVSTCADSWLTTKATTESAETDNPRWIECKTSAGLIGKTFIFNGDDALLLKKGSNVIDCFGASSTGVTTVSTKNCRNEAAWKAKVRNMDYGKKASDYSEEVQEDMDLYGIDLTHDSIELATARSILFRDMAVTSGDDAVAQNTTTFATFSKEWHGRNICGSGTTGKGTCNSFKDLGLFDYNKYYATFDSITTVEEIGGKRNEDGTYTIPIPQLDTLSCSMMRINVYEGSEVKVSREYKVPIMVEAGMGAVLTNDEIFKKHEIPTCKECDVVILKGATLEKTNGANDRDEVRNLMIYPGGTLIVPSGKGDYTVQSVQFRVEKENAPIAKLKGDLITKDQQVIVSRRIKNDRYYFFSLPYDCNIADIRWSNGETPVRGVDYEIVEYDGARRATEGSTQGAPGHWKPVSGTQLKAGVGYNIAVANEYVKELIFPMAIGSTNLTNEENTKTAKTVKIHQYTGSTTINNHNWNLVAHPYVSAFSAYEGDNIRAGWLKYTPSGDPGTPGEWTRESTGSVYLTMPSFNAGAITYEQTVSTGISSLNPFLAVFVQGAGEGDLTFEQTGRKLTAPARHLAAKAEDEDESIFIGVTLSGNDQTDNTYLRVRPDFTEEYELGYDLEKFITFYTARPQVYMKTPTNRLAFQALSDSAAAKMQPMGVYCYQAGTYTFSLNPDFPTDEIEAVYLYDATTGITTNLLYDTYSFSSSKQVYTNTRFALSAVIRRRVAEQTTDLTLTEAEQTPLTRKILIDGHVYILRGGKVFDVTGKQLLNH